MNNPPMTDEDWKELEHGPFIYSDNIEYIYECSICKRSWKESKEPECICLDVNELISLKDHEIENIQINLDTNKTENKIETDYLDDIILHEYGTHNINNYNQWTEDWYKWLQSEKQHINIKLNQ